MNSVWLRELLRLAGLLLVAALLGLVIGRIGLWLFAVVAVYLGWFLIEVRRLERWLSDGFRVYPPESRGIWGEVFQQLFRIQRQARQRKRRIANLLREFRASTEAMPDGTVVLDRNWQIRWFNGAAQRLLGLHGQRDVGQRIGNLVRHPDFIRYLSSGRFAEGVQIDAPNDETRRLSMTLVPYGEGQRLLLVRDVTRIFRLEQMRREFVANASHELRSPLTVVSGYLEAMADDPEVQEDWGRPITEMRRQTGRMSDIIRDMLELSRLENDEVEGEPDEINVAGLAARLREEALALGYGPRDIELDVRSTARLLGHDTEIYSAFSNLVFNAMRYTPPDGSVRIRWEAGQDGGVFSVLDTGVGIASEHIPRLTERFYRVDKSRHRSAGGTGLGLAIVKHALQRHGATLEIQSEPGRGSVFSCRFPARRVQLPAA
ncbi:MAG: phosphate regulon sensor histidine kinase PhoR [Gammaproteobacteria bacterium]